MVPPVSSNRPDSSRATGWPLNETTRMRRPITATIYPPAGASSIGAARRPAAWGAVRGGFHAGDHARVGDTPCAEPLLTVDLAPHLAGARREVDRREGAGRSTRSGRQCEGGLNVRHSMLHPAGRSTRMTG